MKGMVLFFFIFFLLLILGILLFLLNFSMLMESLEKGSSFECGFSSISGMGVVFSMPFFVVSIMFLLFDVEILVLCFYPFFEVGGSYLLMFTYFISFIVLLSTVFEWLKGILNWF